MDKARFDGLMGAYQRTKAENEALKQGNGAQGADGQDDSPDSQPATLEPGLYEVTEDGQVERFQPPTPGVHNEARRMEGDDGSSAYLLRQLSKQSKVGQKPNPWSS